MPMASSQMALVIEILMLFLAIIGIISQSGKTQEKRIGIVVVFSWGLLLFSILILLSNGAFFQLILSGFTSMHGS